MLPETPGPHHKGSGFQQQVKKHAEPGFPAGKAGCGMVHGYHIHMDGGGLCIPGQHHGPVFEEDYFMDTWGHTGDEMGIGGCEKGEKETECGTAVGDPQRPWGTVIL